jgi:regulation of enolase protein 1 (concanavalin A-like superfamily)
VTLAAGSYSLSGLAAQRAGSNSTPQTLVLFVDGNAVATYSPPGTSYTTFTTPSFTVTAGPHVFGLAGLGTNPDGSTAIDTTVFVDDLTIVSTLVIPPSPPVISAITAQSSPRGFPATLQVNATDPQGKALGYTATSLPTGLAINPSTGLVSGTVSTTAAASYKSKITVSDGTLSTSSTFAWATTLSGAPVWKKPSTQTTVRGTAISLQLNVTDPQGAAMTYATTGLPAGLAVNPSTGLISGTVQTTAAASNTVSVTISDGVRGSSGSFTWNTTAPTSTGLTGGDIGAPSLPGTDAVAAGVYTISSNGSGFGGTQDQFHYVSETFTGNGTITARVTSQTNTSPAAQAGVMFRETAAVGARFVSMVLTPYNGFEFQGRDATGNGTGLATANFYPAPNNWVRVVRSGSTFSGYVSNNGTTWTLVGVDTNPMATVVQIGLAVSSVSASPSTATFDNVTITH